MKNAIRLIMAGMLCMVLVAQGQEKAEEAEKVRRMAQEVRHEQERQNHLC